MKKRMLIEFEVFPEATQQAEVFISDFVENVRKHEPATLSYSSFREAKNTCRFIHVMIFENELAQQRHRNSENVKVFTDKLYRICSQEPKFTEMNHFISK
jgi:quinol monooxygenase YgiN